MNNVNVTVLKDESLGGVEREYTEVKRKARVGEQIKIVAAECTFGHYANGDVITITKVGRGEAYFPVEKRESNPDGIFYANQHEYVVLEPTDIVGIDGERFRMVDRKAAVGERVIVTEPESDADEHGNYKPGDTATIKYTNVDSYETYYRAETPDGRKIDVYAKEYRVLEPLTTPLSSRPAEEQSAEIIATLTAEVESLKKRVTALERADSPTVIQTEPALVATFKSPQQIRDEIVERAKADVETLTAKVAGSGWYDSEIPSFEKHGPLVIDFAVNRDKRKVTAIARYKHVPDVVAEVGRAVCAPNDVFNAHIGKVIALRRALGLEVQAEYLSAPGPEIANIGDIVKTYGALKFEVTYGASATAVTSLLRSGDAVILDDTREEVAA